MSHVNRTWWLLLLVPLSALAESREVDYMRDVKPLLAEKCSTCHGVLKQEAGLRLDHGRLLRNGGDDGEVIDVQDAIDSKLLQRVSSADEEWRMPPAGEGEPLTAEQVSLLRDWIADGARSPDDESIPVGPDQHWAWQLPSRPSMLTSSIPNEWSQNPVDVLVYAKLREAGLQPMPLADRRTRMRRLYLDLIGLPPSRQEQLAFLSDSTIDAWPSLVDQLLENPAHGERWARHWMDVWRYSDWDGYQQEVRGSQRHIWRWRDWIVDSLNADKGYDRMVVEMLAGDELDPTNHDVLRATGFLARNYHNSNRNIWLDATVEHTAKAFLSMTVNCARCHDHKYDPIGQQEYYAFRAIFEPHHVRIERLPGQPDIKQLGLVRAFDAKLDEPTYLFAGGNEKLPDKEHPLTAAAPSVIGLPLDIRPIELPVEAVFPALRVFVEQEDIAATEKQLSAARKHLATLDDEASGDLLASAKQAVLAAEAELESLTARWTADKARFDRDSNEQLITETRAAAVSAEHQVKVANAKLTLMERRAKLDAAEASTDESAEESAEKPAEKDSAIEKAKKELAEAQQQLDSLAGGPAEDAEYTSVGEIHPAKSTGRRLALARWITHADNPLTARVAVNYIWMHHFGEPLVANVFDFGLRSAEPTHRDLLDWLAVELVSHHWSMKHIHRVITTSRTYQLASSHDTSETRTSSESWSKNQALDGENRLFWRANVRRLDAEVVRDSLLHATGNLNQEFGGPDIDFTQGEQIPRRSLYFRHAYEKQMTMLVLFDAAAPTECYRRSPSIVPQQALALANSPLTFDQSRSFANSLAAA